MGVIGSSTAPPLDGIDTSLTPEQRQAYAEIGAAMAAGDRTATSMEEWRALMAMPSQDMTKKEQPK